MFSYGHENLDLHSKEYWDYSFPDMRYDIKANIDYVYEQTKKKIHYVGHSTGSIAMIACLADPDKSWRNHAEDIQNKIHIFYAVAPVIFIVRIQKFFLKNIF